MATSAADMEAARTLQHLRRGMSSVFRGCASSLLFSGHSSCESCGEVRANCQCKQCITCGGWVHPDQQKNMRNSSCTKCRMQQWRLKQGSNSTPAKIPNNSNDGEHASATSTTLCFGTSSPHGSPAHAGDTPMTDTNHTTTGHARWSEEHVLTLLQYMKSIRHTAFCMTGQRPDPNLNPWTVHAASYVNAECGLSLNAADISIRVRLLRDKWGAEPASFSDCMQETKKRVTEKSIHWENEVNTEDMKKEIRFLRRSLGNVTTQLTKIAALPASQELAAKLRDYAGKQGPLIGVHRQKQSQDASPEDDMNLLTELTQAHIHAIGRHFRKLPADVRGPHILSLLRLHASLCHQSTPKIPVDEVSRMLLDAVEGSRNMWERNRPDIVQQVCGMTARTPHVFDKDGAWQLLPVSLALSHNIERDVGLY